jgi:tetratricopeptide (TPR) repeat protein
MKCPNCGAQSDGAFCSECGAPLKGAKCRECNASLSAGARFCNNCGTATGRVAARGEPQNKLPWIMAGASLLLLIGVFAWPALKKDGNTNQSDGRVPLGQMSGTGAPDAGAGGAPGPLTGTPREQADRLFNRVMAEREGGDTAQAKFFVPMAVQAYDMAGAKDNDALYHVSLLQNVAGDFKASRDAAEKILATDANHLLALSAAASAARRAGDNSAARNYYQKFLQNYETESKSTKQEYLDHGKMLPDLKTEAEAFLKGR